MRKSRANEFLDVPPVWLRFGAALFLERSMSCQDTQNERLIAYLKRHHFITRRTAAVGLEIMNLWSRIAEIEEEIGYKLDRRWITTKTGKRVLEYWWRPAKARKAA